MHQGDRGGCISIIQEALKRAQDNYASRESLSRSRPGLGFKVERPASVREEVPEKLAIVKKIAVIVSIIALCALVTGFGMRILFSKMLAMGKEKRPKDLITEARKTGAEKEVDKTGPDKMVSQLPPVKDPQPMAQAQEPVVVEVQSVKAPQPVIQEPVAVALPSRQESQVQSFVLNGIMYIKKKPVAIVNGVVVAEGDVISGATVTSISKSKVSLEYINNDNRAEIVLKLKE